MIRRRLAVAFALVMLPTLAGFAADDPFGDPIPEGAKARLGTARMRNVAGGSPTALTPDGKFFVATAVGGGVNYMDPVTGKTVRTLQIERGFGSPIAFSADGKRGLMAGFPDSFVYDTENGKVLSKVTRNATVGDNAVSLSADGKLLALGTARPFNDKDKDKPLTAVVWDVDASKELTSVSVPQNQSVNVAISADGKRLATWGYHSDRNAKEPPKPENDLNRLIQFWDAANGKEIAKARLTTGYSPVSVVFAPGGGLVAVSSGDSAMQLFDPATGEAKGMLLGRARQGRKLAFSPDGKTLAAAGDDGSVQRWSVADGKRLGTTEAPASIMYGPRAILFTDNERILVWGARGTATMVWEAPSGKLLTAAGGHFNSITSVALAGGKEVYTGAADGIILRWDPATGKELGTLSLKLPGAGNIFGAGVVTGAVAISPDGTRALASDANGNALYDLPSGTQQFVVPGEQGRDARASFSTDSTKIVQTLSAYDPKKTSSRVVVWDIASAKQLGSVEMPGVSQVTASVSPDGKMLVTGAVKQEEKGPGTFIVTGWELATGKKLGEYGHQESAFGTTSVAAAGDNKCAVVFTPKGEAIIVDCVAGTKVRNLDLTRRRTVGAPVVSPDGKSVAVALGVSFGANPTSTILICDIESGKVKKTLNGASGAVSTMAFSADGKTLLTGSYDTTTLVWDITGQ